jgi:eukaryotic-like serine/threonine-protein kinase
MVLGFRMLQADVIPHRIGPYRVLSRLGAGGLCEVFLAEAYGASGFVRRVAIKRLHSALEGEADLVRALIREAQLGGWLRHRGLVSVHDLGCEEGRYFVVMEWIDGFDLATLIAAMPPPAPVARTLASELASTLEYVHRACDLDGRALGLVHRDLSANNVLLSREGEVKLCDFGLAKATLLADHSRGDLRKGTYAYMSPEQVEPSAHHPLTQASDQFAFGVLLAELLTGHRPFDRDSVLDTMHAIREAPLPTWPSLGEPTLVVLRTCLAREKNARVASTAALRDRLRTHDRCADLTEIVQWIELAVARLRTGL